MKKILGWLLLVSFSNLLNAQMIPSNTNWFTVAVHQKSLRDLKLITLARDITKDEISISQNSRDQFANCYYRNTLIGLTEKELLLTCVRETYSKQINKYLSDERFLKSLDLYLHERLALRPVNMSDYYDSAINIKDEIYFILSDMLEKNLPWTYLFTAEDFRVEQTYVTILGGNPQDYYELYLQNFSRNLSIKQQFDQYVATSADTNKSRDVDLNTLINISVSLKDSPNAAGFISTNAFDIRYPTNAVNLGRKKSAAILKFSLCDSMVPSALSSPEERDSQLRHVLGLESISNSVGKVDLHAQQKDCKTCHLDRGLDPLAETLNGTFSKLDLNAYSGGFVQKTLDGPRFVAVNSLREYVSKMIDSTDFVNCQWNHLWNKYVGKDRQSGAVHEWYSDLMKELDLRKTPIKEVILEILLRRIVMYFESVAAEEYHQTKTKQGHLAFNQEKVTLILNQCQACHDEVSVYTDFKRPSKYVLERVADVLQFKQDDPQLGHANRKMPPVDQREKWDLSLDDWAQLKYWYQNLMQDSH